MQTSALLMSQWSLYRCSSCLADLPASCVVGLLLMLRLYFTETCLSLLSLLDLVLYLLLKMLLNTQDQIPLNMPIQVTMSGPCRSHHTALHSHHLHLMTLFTPLLMTTVREKNQNFKWAIIKDTKLKDHRV